MRLLVISDTHGRTEEAVAVYEKMKDVDMILHLGDMTSDAELLQRQLGIAVLSVKGNMDGEYSFDGFKLLETECGKIYLAHGHMENVKFGPQTIMYRAMEQGCRAALFGHTHVPYMEEVNGVYLINPGSLTQPRGGRPGSYAVINTSEEAFEAGIVYTEKTAVAPGCRKSGIQGGYIRELLNNSDRF